VSRFRDLVGIAIGGILARKARTLLIMLGPVVGVAAMVGAVGLTESAKGDLKARLDELGTTLITAEAGSAFGRQNPTLPTDSVRRVRAIPAVVRASAVAEVPGVVTLPSEGGADYFETFPVPVLAADSRLPAVLEVPVRSGRWLDRFDEEGRARTAVIGAGLADEFDYLPGELRTIELNGLRYAVVGVLDRVELEPGFDNAVFIPFTAAADDFLDLGVNDDIEPNKLYARSMEGAENDAAEALKVAVNLGGPQDVSTEIKSEALELAAQSDRQLQLIVVSMGLLAIIVGGLGIANVMSISVIQRSAEIGIRRALGHTRRIIAMQFLLEAVVVGVLGGVLGVLLGMFSIFVGASIAGWVFVMAPWLAPAGIILAIVISAMAGLYPSTRAARLEPLETLRLG